MDTWKSALALTVAGVMLAGPALAQSGGSSGSGGGNTTTPQMGTQQPSASGTSTSSGTSGTSGTPKSTTKGDMKSGDMKSGDMKSGDMKAGKMARSGGAEQVKAVQQALKDKGMDPGNVDGKMGPKTQSALREYQKKEGLKESGRLDTETMAKLGVAKTSDTGTTTPSASPSTDSSTTGSTPSGAAANPSSGPGAATGGGSSSVPSKQAR